MKSLLPWFCLVAAGQHFVYADNGIEMYRQGDYMLAAQSLPAAANDPVANYYMGLMRLYGYGELKNNAMALRYFVQSAEKGFLPAQQLLARYYLNHAHDPKQAFQWFKAVAQADVTSAQMFTAAAYLFGYGTAKSEDSAARFYIEAAKNGNPTAQYHLAEHFLQSRDNRNKKMGLIWLNKAVDQGNPLAQWKLGDMYATGTLVSRDVSKAKELLNLALKKQSVLAMVSFGELAKQENDWQTAKDWFSKAAQANNPQGKMALAKLYLDPKSPLFDVTEGFAWMQKAAEQGFPAAQLALADLYKKGQGTEKNDSLAALWQQKAKKGAPAIKNVEQAMARWLSNDQTDVLDEASYQLGGIYSAWQNPNALKENNYNQAPQMNHLSRQDLYKPHFVLVQPTEVPISDYFDVLAPMISSKQPGAWSFPHYELEKQISSLLRDEALALKHDADAPSVDEWTSYPEDNEIKPFDYLAEKTEGWQHQANFQAVLNQLYSQAILGESTAQYELGQLYQYGVGVAKNTEQAVTYYQLAAMQQEIRAEYNLGMMYLTGQITPLDYKKGLEWMTDAAFKGNPYAQYVLANIYEQGLTTPQGEMIVSPNHPQAMAMFYLASSNHYGDAEFQLADYLVHEKKSGLSVAAKDNRNKLIKRLYQGAVHQGIAEAILPLAFYNAMDSNPAKQQEAFEVAKSEAQAGNSEAALLLGIMFERGISVAADSVQAIYWYQQGANSSINDFILGTLLCEGKGLSKDTVRGEALLQKAADAGFSYANLNLAILREQNGQAFLPELDKARQLGNTKAGLLLADYYLLMSKDPEQMKEASGIYQYLADKGDKEAQTKLAFLYDHGLLGESNNEMAAKWYALAAEQGQPLAQYLLGQMYQLGRIGKYPDYEQAKKWYQASLVSYQPAAVAIGFIYDTVDNNYNDAAKNYTLAANAGDAIAQYNLGLIYEYGKGIPVDLSKASLLFEQAAKQGNAPAMSQLAGLYFKGIDGHRDEQQALTWYKKAAALGESNAMYQLGLLSETGVLTALNYQNALKYYQQAATSGNEKAKMAMARMYQYGLGVQKDMAQAEGIYKQLAANDNAYAQYQLALMYLKGMLGAPQIEQGKQLLKKASENGSKPAQIILERLNAEKESQLSFIQPLLLNKVSPGDKPASLMYLDALNEWNRGDEISSRTILNQLMTRFPDYVPAKRAYEELNNQRNSAILG